MLARLNMLAPYLALGLLGYLTYSATDGGSPRTAEAKDTPMIGKALLQPALLEAHDRSSPASRDPFDVSWSTYLAEERPPAGTTGAHATSAPASVVMSPGPGHPTTTAPAAGASTTQTASAPAAAPPPLPQRLGGIFVSQGLCRAMIDDVLYGQNDDLPVADDGRHWTVDRIEVDSVVLKFGDVRQRLRLPGAAAEKQTQH